MVVAYRVYSQHRRMGDLESIFKVIMECFHGDHTQGLRKLYELCESGVPYGEWTTDQRDSATAIMANLNLVGHAVENELIEEHYVLPEYIDRVLKCWISIQPLRDAHTSPEPWKWPGFKWFAREAYERMELPSRVQLAELFENEPKGYEDWNLQSLFPPHRKRGAARSLGGSHPFRVFAAFFHPRS